MAVYIDEGENTSLPFLPHNFEHQGHADLDLNPMRESDINRAEQSQEIQEAIFRYQNNGICLPIFKEYQQALYDKFIDDFQRISTEYNHQINEQLDSDRSLLSRERESSLM